MFCRKCGAQNQDGVNFCRACGNPLNAASVASAPVTPAPKKPKKKNTGLIVGIIAGILVVVAAVVGILFATGVFGGNDSEKEEDVKTEETVKDKNKDKDEQDQVNQNTIGATEITIGLSGPFTGDYNLYGQSVSYGAQLAVDEINQAGGINGIKLRLISEDDGANPENVTSVYSSLCDKGMKISLGSVTSGCCEKFIDQAEIDNMFVLTPTATASNIIDSDNAFRVCDEDSAQGTMAADYIADNNLASKVAVLYDLSDNYSTNVYERFNAEAVNRGLQIVTVETFTYNTNTDFSAQLQSIKTSGAELVFIPVYYTEATIILTQAKQMGLETTFLACDGVDGILSVENFNKDFAEGLMLTLPFAPIAEDDITKGFVDRFTVKYGETYLNTFSAQAYDAVYILKAAIEKSKITADMDASEMCDLLKKVMPQIRFEGVTGIFNGWGTDGESVKEPKVVIIKNGKYTKI